MTLRLVILGSTNDDKGIQLEQLSSTLLSQMGYEIVNNYIGSGGQEIDIRAQKKVTAASGDEQIITLICECKAHAKPNNITDWLKFLGKIFSEEVRIDQEVRGYFIALTGVNGNVMGAYDAFSEKRNSVSLIRGQDLIKHITDIYNLCSFEDAKQNVQNLTSRSFLKAEIIYYQNSVYWVFQFEDDTYTLLNSRGLSINADQLLLLEPLIKEETSLAVGSYIDLQKEAEAEARRLFVKKLVLAQLMLENGSTNLANLLAENDGFVQDEFERALSDLVNDNFVVRGEENTQILLPSDDMADSYERLVEIYRFLLTGISMVKVLGCGMVP